MKNEILNIISRLEMVFQDSTLGDIPIIQAELHKIIEDMEKDSIKFVKLVFRCHSCGSVQFQEEEKRGNYAYCYSKECKKVKFLPIGDTNGTNIISGTKMISDGEIPMIKCKECSDEAWFDESDWEAPDGSPHHGVTTECYECNASYYEEYGSEIVFATNKQAKFNHPELDML